MTHPKPDNAPFPVQEFNDAVDKATLFAKDLHDNAPTPTGPVLSAEQIAARYKLAELCKGIGGESDRVLPLLDSHEALRDLLAQRDKRVEELQVRLGQVSEVCARSLIVSKNRQVALQDIQRLSTGWKYGNEGNHLLRINDVASAAIDAAMKEPKP